MNLKLKKAANKRHSQHRHKNQMGQASFEFISTFFLGILIVCGCLFIVWLVALKIFLQSLVFEASAAAAHNFALSFNNKIFIDNESIKQDLKTQVSKFPFLNALGLSASHSRFELNYVSQSKDSKYSQNNLADGTVDANVIAAVQANFYFCLQGIAKEFAFLKLYSSISSSTNRDCLGQFHSRESARNFDSSQHQAPNQSNSLRLLFVSASHSVLQSNTILQSGLPGIDMQKERQLFYNYFFKKPTR